MDNEKYWKRRQQDHQAKVEAMATVQIGEMVEVYEESYKILEDELISLYSKHSQEGVLTPAILKEPADKASIKKYMSKLNRRIARLRLNPDNMYDPSELAKLTRLRALIFQIETEIAFLREQETLLATKFYTDVLQNTYTTSQKTFELMGYTPQFSRLPKERLQSMLALEFAGSNYSERIYDNTEKLAQLTKRKVIASIQAGASQEKTVRALRQRFDVGESNLQRLVRTETNYMRNQAELQTYIDDGFKRYQYDARLDGRTSDICRELNNDEFLTKDAQVGKNYPPMHPNCRSTTTVVLDSFFDD